MWANLQGEKSKDGKITTGNQEQQCNMLFEDMEFIAKRNAQGFERQKCGKWDGQGTAVV